MIAFRNPIPEYQPPKPFVSFPCARLVIHIKFSVCAVMHRWLLQAYTRDVRSRLPQLLATATSIYGRILKIDSTKKVVKKLQGAAADTATWVTNVGNEKGEVLISVVTESEGLLSLRWINEAVSSFSTTDGNVLYCSFGGYFRYREAEQDPPVIVYTRLL